MLYTRSASALWNRGSVLSMDSSGKFRNRWRNTAYPSGGWAMNVRISAWYCFKARDSSWPSGISQLSSGDPTIENPPQEEWLSS